MILAVAGGSDLLQRTQQVFFQKRQSKVVKVSYRGRRGGREGGRDKQGEGGREGRREGGRERGRKV